MQGLDRDGVGDSSEDGDGMSRNSKGMAQATAAGGRGVERAQRGRVAGVVPVCGGGGGVWIRFGVCRWSR